MLRLSCLLLAISLTLSSRVLTKVSSALTIYTNGPSLINDAYQVLYDKPKETIYFFTVPSTIYPDSIYMSPDISEVRSYGVSYNNVINPLTRKTQQLSGSFQSTSKASQVKPPYIAYTAGVGYPITTNTNVNYQASGLSWATYYTLYLSADETRANVEGYINVNNRSGKNFTQIQLKLLVGKSVLYRYKLQNGDFVEQKVQNNPSQQQANMSRQLFRDRQLYREQINISEGNNRIGLFKTIKNAPVKKIFTANVEVGVPRQQLKFITEYRVENKKNYGIDFLSKGTGRILKKNSRGVTQQLAVNPTEDVYQWSDITFKAGSPSNIKSQYIGNYIKSEYVSNRNRAQLKITNLASTPANIELKLFDRENNIISYNTGYKGPRWAVDDGYWITSTTIPGNSQKTIQWNETENLSAKK